MSVLTAEQLLAGPRGRRLLLAFAEESEAALLGYDVERPLGWAVFDASFALARAHGQSVSRFGWGEALERPELTPDDVAARLEVVPLAEPAGALLFGALRTSVESAMYWQEPDGEDLLCAIPVVRDALARVAEHLVAAPDVRSWATPMDRADQWQVLFMDDPMPRPPNLSEWRDLKIAEEARSRRERPTDPGANWTGEWWSHPPYGFSSTRRREDEGPLRMWLIEDAQGWEACTAYRLEVAASARVLELDGPQSWAALCRDFPLDVTASRRHDWYRTTGRDGTWLIPDWSLVAEHYDGVHLSIAGYLAAATRAVPVGTAASVVAGWHPDSTWWLTDAVRPVGTPTRWRFHDDAESSWTPTD